MSAPDLEFSFISTLKPRKIRRASKQTRTRVRREKLRLERRSKYKSHLSIIIQTVADKRGVAWQRIFSPDRESDAVSSARVLAMAMCAALDIPLFIVARALGRDWATIYSAEVRCSTLYRESEDFRAEWDAIIEHCRLSISPEKA